MTTNMQNPFFVDATYGDIDVLSQKELYQLYPKVYGLCLKESYSHTKEDKKMIRELFSEKVSESTFQKCSNLLVLKECSHKLIRNKTHKAAAVLVDKDKLSKFNHDKLELSDTILVVPFLQLTESNLRFYNSLYQDRSTLNDFIQALVLSNYYNCDSYKMVIQPKIQDLALQSKETCYWMQKYNCLLNMTERFMNRNFDLKHVLKARHKLNALANSISNNDTEIKKYIQMLERNKSPVNYLDFLNDKVSYIDISSAIEKKGRKLYYPPKEAPQFTEDHLMELFNSFDNEKDTYTLYNSLLLSKDLCHFALNSEKVMDKVKPLINKMLPLYRYLFGYAWQCMLLDEAVIRTNVKNSDRYVFTLDTARNLPFFPFNNDNLNMNPYTPVHIAKKILDSKNNFMGLKMIKDHDYSLRSMSSFRNALNVFLTGSSKHDYFGNIDWTGLAISGSVMPACLPQNPTLMKIHQKAGMTEEQALNKMFEIHYGKSDIDLMCKEISVYKFMDKTLKFIQSMEKSIDMVTKTEGNKMIIKPTKSMLILVNEKYLDLKFSGKYDIEKMIREFNENWVREIFYVIYAKYKIENNMKNRFNEKHKDNPLYDHFYKMNTCDEMNLCLTSKEITLNSTGSSDDTEYYIRLNDMLHPSKQVPDEENEIILRIAENVKFKLSNSNLKREFEMFRFKGDDFFAIVSRFHLPCVRSYYDGTNVYILPSAITALYTQVNIDYKYFAGIKDPVDILDKYRFRGFGILVNENEKKGITEYNATVQPYKDLYKVDMAKPDTVKQFYGSLELNDPRFRTGITQYGFNPNDYQNVAVDYVNTEDDVKEWYKTKCGYDTEKASINFLKFNTIDNYGYVVPLKRWLLEAAWDEFN